MSFLFVFLSSKYLDVGTCFSRNQSIALICSYYKNVEWTTDHDIQLTKEIFVSEPYRFKSRTVVSLGTVERGKMWQYVDRSQIGSNEATNIHFRVTKRSARFHCTRERIPHLM